MKRASVLQILAILLILTSCGPAITFDEPQPANKSILKRFPKGVIGNYINSKTNNILEITENQMLMIYNYKGKENINKLDSNIKLSGDTLIVKESKEKYKIKREGDSILFDIHLVDTLFSISEKNVLKKFKGYYFLNYLRDKAGWEVKKMELSKGELMISEINKKEELDNLKEISESALDTLPFKFKPTKNQFRRFVREKGFRDTEKYLKIK